MRKGIIVTAPIVFGVFAMCLRAEGQGAPGLGLRADEREESFSSWLPAPQAAPKDHRFSLGLRAEYWRPELDADDFTPTISTTVNGVPVTLGPGESLTASGSLDSLIMTHSAFLLVGEYSYSMKSGAIRAWFGVGLETIGYDGESTISTVFTDLNGPLPSDDFINTNSGTAEAATISDPEMVFELGIGYLHRLDKFDLGGSISFRAGEADLEESQTTDDRDSLGGTPTDHDVTTISQEIGFEYTLFRVQLEAGWNPTQGVRPFIGIRFTMYEGEIDFTQVTTFSDFVPPPTFTTTQTQTWDTDAELESVLGVSLGVELSSGPVGGRLELMFVDVDSVGAMASVGYVF